MPMTYANVEDIYKSDSGLKKEDIKNLQEWIKLQPHLPEITDLQMILFHHSCYFSNEATKRCIDNYFTVRTHCPEFFSNQNPKLPEILNVHKCCTLSLLPKPTPAGYTILYAGLKDTNPAVYDFNNSFKVVDMIASITLQQNGPRKGYVVILDLKGATLTHLMKTSVISVKKVLYFVQEALPFRLKGFHFVNAVPFMDKIMALIKPFLNKELLELIQIHQGTNETILKTIPKECLPEEVGGLVGSAKSYQEDVVKSLNENGDFLLEIEILKSDESRRPGKPRNSGDLFGVEGTFKKLDID